MTSELLGDYSVIVEREELPDGQQIYVARHREFPTLFGQGDTPGEAIADLSDTREAAVEHLKEYNLPVPKPLPFPERVILGLRVVDADRGEEHFEPTMRDPIVVPA
jgi:predicted RNase H-like HicB family nuclease